MGNSAIQNPNQQPTSFSNVRLCFLDDDDEFNANLESDLMRVNLRNNSIITSTYQEALESISQNRCDIVVSDYNMPKKNGIEFLEQLREQNDNLILVLYTGFTQSIASEAKQRCNKAKIQILKKIDGFETLVENLKLYYTNRNPMAIQSLYIKPKITMPPLLDKEILSHRITEVVHRNTEKISPEKILLDLASDLIKDIDRLQKEKAVITVDGGKRTITMTQLKEEILNFTPIGMKYLASWFKAQKLIRNSSIKKQNDNSSKD